MKKYLLLLFTMMLSVTIAKAWVYTSFHWHNGFGWLQSQEFDIDSEEGKQKVLISAAENIKTGNWFYFLVLIFNNTSGENQAWFPKGVELKIRVGNENVFSSFTQSDYKWVSRQQTELEYDTNKTMNPGVHVSGVSNYIKYDPIRVYYPITLEELKQIAENGFMKIRYQNNSKQKYYDLNFTPKQTKSSAKTFKKHLDNLLGQQKSVEKKVIETRERWAKEKEQKKQEAQPIGEF